MLSIVYNKPQYTIMCKFRKKNSYNKHFNKKYSKLKKHIAQLKNNVYICTLKTCKNLSI